MKIVTFCRRMFDVRLLPYVDDDCDDAYDHDDNSDDDALDADSKRISISLYRYGITCLGTATFRMYI